MLLNPLASWTTLRGSFSRAQRVSHDRRSKAVPKKDSGYFDMSIKLQLARIACDAGGLREPLNIALRLLFRAYQFALDARANPWEFAVEIEEFQRMGVTKSDLRWLILKGLAVHAREVADPDYRNRNFCRFGKHSLPAGTCFVLSDNVARDLTKRNDKTHLSLDIYNIILPVKPTTPGELTGATSACLEPLLPQWDVQRKELRLDGLVVKKFRAPAPNQESVIRAFEEERWPIRIDDPLPPVPEQDCRRRLIDTIKYLNRNQVNALIRFRGDGTGKGVLWELRE